MISPSPNVITFTSARTSYTSAIAILSFHTAIYREKMFLIFMSHLLEDSYETIIDFIVFSKILITIYHSHDHLAGRLQFF